MSASSVTPETDSDSGHRNRAVSGASRAPSARAVQYNGAVGRSFDTRDMGHVTASATGTGQALLRLLSGEVHTTCWSGTYRVVCTLRGDVMGGGGGKFESVYVGESLRLVSTLKSMSVKVKQLIPFSLDSFKSIVARQLKLFGIGKPMLKMWLYQALVDIFPLILYSDIMSGCAPPHSMKNSMIPAPVSTSSSTFCRSPVFRCVTTMAPPHLRVPAGVC